MVLVCGPFLRPGKRAGFWIPKGEAQLLGFTLWNPKSGPFSGPQKRPTEQGHFPLRSCIRVVRLPVWWCARASLPDTPFVPVVQKCFQRVVRHALEFDALADSLKTKKTNPKTNKKNNTKTLPPQKKPSKKSPPQKKPDVHYGTQENHGMFTWCAPLLVRIPASAKSMRASPAPPWVPS